LIYDEGIIFIFIMQIQVCMGRKANIPYIHRIKKHTKFFLKLVFNLSILIIGYKINKKNSIKLIFSHSIYLNKSFYD